MCETDPKIGSVFVYKSDEYTYTGNDEKISSYYIIS